MLSKLFSILKGGSGSGNFGHAGIPGKRGGSVSRSSISKWNSPPTTSESNALLSYRGEFSTDANRPDGISIFNSDEINSNLRGSSESYLSSKDKKEVKSLIANLDSVIKKGELEKDTVLYRGLSKKQARSWNNLGEEDVISDRGFMSTTTSPERANFFAGGDSGVLLKIKLPKGSKVADIDSFVESKDKEKEFLLPRNSRFLVEKVVKTKKGGSIVTVVPTKKSPDWNHWFTGIIE